MHARVYKQRVPSRVKMWRGWVGADVHGWVRLRSHLVAQGSRALSGALETGIRDDAVVSIVFVGKPRGFRRWRPCKLHETLKLGDYSDVSLHFPVALFCE